MSGAVKEIFQVLKVQVKAHWEAFAETFQTFLMLLNALALEIMEYQEDIHMAMFCAIQSF